MVELARGSGDTLALLLRAHSGAPRFTHHDDGDGDAAGGDL